MMGNLRDVRGLYLEFFRDDVNAGMGDGDEIFESWKMSSVSFSISNLFSFDC